MPSHENVERATRKGEISTGPQSRDLGNLRSTPTTSRASEPWSVRELLPRESANRSGDSHPPNSL